MTILKNLRCIGIVSLLLLISCADKPEAGKQVLVSEGLTNKVIDGYWLYLPIDHDPGKEWPIILFLQGGHGASPDPRTSKDAGPAKYALVNAKKFEDAHSVMDSFLIINPHMKVGPMGKRQWYQYSKTLVQIVDEVIKKYSGDQNRVYLTGLSRGGHGSWGLAKRYPEKFAAILPIAGAITCKAECEKISDIPMWIIHNLGDNIVKHSYSLESVEFMEKELGKSFLKLSSIVVNQEQLSSKYILSSVEKEGHDAWTMVYSSPQIYEWLLNKKLSKK